MSVQDACMPVERLSSYLDRELTAEDHRRVEDHLAACPGCRAHLASLRRVVDDLRRLERAAPPPTLAQHVQRRVALDRPGTTRLGRWEAELHRMRPRLSVFFPFAMVFALAAILLLFADRLDRDRNRGPVVVIPPPEAAAAFGDPDDELRRSREVREVRETAGRTFHRDGDAWVQTGLSEDAPRWQHPTDSEPFRRVHKENPWLSGLLADASQVVFADGGGVYVFTKPDAVEEPAD